MYILSKLIVDVGFLVMIVNCGNWVMDMSRSIVIYGWSFYFGI